MRFRNTKLIFGWELPSCSVPGVLQGLPEQSMLALAFSLDLLVFKASVCLRAKGSCREAL